MPIERVFVGWDRVPVEAAREWLVRIADRVGSSIDLSRVGVCLPTARAGRLLLNLLVDSAERAGGVLLPPTILTPGALLKVFQGSLSKHGRSASPLARRLAWSLALESLSSESLRHIRGGMVFEDEDPLPLASIVAGTHARLTAELCTFAAARSRLPPMQSEQIERRLTALAEAEGAYASVLAREGLDDAAYSAALTGSTRDGTDSRQDSSPAWDRLVLIGLADVPAPLRQVLEASVESRDPRVGPVTALIIAPESLTGRFDAFGAVLPEAWEHSPIDLGGVRVAVVDTAADLIVATLDAVSKLPQGTRACDVVLGVTDDELTPALVRRAALAHLAVRPAAAGRVAQSPTASLLRGVLELAIEPTFRAWGTLLRHPWFERAVLDARAMQDGAPHDRRSSTEDWLEALDRYVLEHLPDRLTGQFVHDRDTSALESLWHATRGLLGDLCPEVEGPARRRSEKRVHTRRSLSAWAEVIGNFLDGMVPESQSGFPARVDSDEERLDEAVRAAFDSALDTLGDLAASPGLDRPVSADTALGLVLELASEATLPPRDVANAVELVGWLELVFDPAAHVVIVGLAEGQVPSREVNDPLLPPALLRSLGLLGTTSRVARDAYALQLLARSRQSLVVLVSRRGADGEPSPPSRLLFQADDATVLARARLWSPKANAPPPTLGTVPSRRTAAASDFRPMPMPVAGVPDRWRVTAFKDYLKSPYSFYRRHVVRVSELEEESTELRPHRFGTLIHAVLRDFGASPARTLTEKDAIFTSVRELFRHHLSALVGPRVSATLWVQGEQAISRLEGFAQWQAARTRQGWTITHTEWSPGDDGVPFLWDNGTIQLSGRIDRIDEHPEQGLQLIDYKVFETAKTPQKTHRAKDGWTDLQLPLYRHLAAEIVLERATRLKIEPAIPVLAYISLPAEEDHAKLLAADWTLADLESADRIARDVIAAVHAGRFQEQGGEPPTGGSFGAMAGFGHLGEIDDGGDDEEAGEARP